MWAKLSLAARARFLRTEEEHVDARWVADDEALRVGSSMTRRSWYDAAEEDAEPVDTDDLFDNLTVTNINVAIEERLTDLTNA